MTADVDTDVFAIIRTVLASSGVVVERIRTAHRGGVVRYYEIAPVNVNSQGLCERLLHEMQMQGAAVGSITFHEHGFVHLACNELEITIVPEVEGE